MKSPLKHHPTLEWIGSPLEPETKLWRYIRLSTFLLLLMKKHVFVPTIATLRSADPTESSVLCQRTNEYFQNLDEPSMQWLSKFKNKENRGSAMKTWMAQIVERRCAWCWHNAQMESMGFWHIYAREGVAICTSPRRLIECLAPSKYIKAVGIGRVEYHSRDRIVNGSEATLLRPYMIKQKCYEFEKEVRIIFPVSRPHHGGLTLRFEPAHLLEEVAISPFMPGSEAAAIRQITSTLCPNVRCEPSDVLDKDRFRSHLVKAVGEKNRQAWEDLMFRPGIAKFGIVSRLPAMMKYI